MKRTASRRAARALATFGAAAALAYGLPGTAQAAADDGEDPVSSGCSSTAITAEQHVITDVAGATVGWAQLRYSTACRTVWGRVLTPYAAWAYGSASVQRNSDGAIEYRSDADLAWSSSLGDYTTYTAMLNDKNVTSFATGCVYNRAISEEDCWDTASY